MCKDKVGWDEELEGNLSKRWNQLTTELEVLSTIKIPRCYYLAGKVLVRQQVHRFCDASERAYAAAIYLRSVYCSDESMYVSVCLISSKTHVAPIEKAEHTPTGTIGSHNFSSVNSCSFKLFDIPATQIYIVGLVLILCCVGSKMTGHGDSMSSIEWMRYTS